ncbi:MAG: ATP-dependent sacrificial sulfur transferase LarE [Thermoplasmata archaeon]
MGYMVLTSSPAPIHPAAAPSVIEARLSAGGPTLVALSGGVDSSVVAMLAHRALGAKSVAVTLTGPAVSSEELGSARAVARRIGIRHVVLTSDPLSDDRYAENPTNRCYFCRNHEGDLLRKWGTENSVEVYLDGIHVDDLGDDRPGLQAMNEHGFRHPLAEAGWSKMEVRAFARSEGLPNWERPSNACLASRITHGQLITVPLLERVGRAEEWLAARGFRRVRVRVVGDHARVEVGSDEVPRLLEATNAEPLREALLGFGFASVEIDPAGYRPRLNA